jgi:hypothetical protein
MSATLGALPHCNVTIVPYIMVGGRRPVRVHHAPSSNGDRHVAMAATHPTAPDGPVPVAGSIPIAEMPPRLRAVVTGRVVAMRVQPWGGAATLEATLRDESGEVTLVFLGRRSVAGVRPGTVMAVDGVLGEHLGRLAVLNPSFTLLSVPEHEERH